jgi:hypothetical protein
MNGGVPYNALKNFSLFVPHTPYRNPGKSTYKCHRLNICQNIWVLLLREFQ